MIQIKHEGLKKDLPDFRPGDTLRVHARVVEGDSERTQLFDGVVVARKGTGIAATFTVRKTSFGVGVERIFPLHSPRVEKIEVIKKGKVRRAKLFYLRDLAGKSARVREEVVAEQETAAAAVGSAPAAETAAPAPETPAPMEQK